MDRLFVLTVFIMNRLQYVQTAQWSATFQDGSIVDACAGDVSVTFPWKITLGSGEEIANIEWFYRGRSEEMIGTSTHGSFFSTPAFSQRVEQVGDLGLTLSHVVEGDAGNYSVEVMVRDTSSGDAHTLRHTATLMVYTEVTAMTAITLTVAQEPEAVYDNVTGHYYVQLTCTAPGRQPAGVVWTLPSGESVVVSPAENGHFPLLVASPVPGGNYTCRVHPDTLAATCLPASSPTRTGATIHVDSMQARLTLLEAQQRHLQAENNQLRTDVNQLKTDNGQLRTDLTHLRTENSQLQKENNQMKTNFSYLQTDSSQLKTDVSQLQGENTQLKRNISQLRADNSRLQSDVSKLQTDSTHVKTDVNQLQTDVGQLKTDSGRMKTDISQLRTENSQLKANTSQLQTDTSRLETDVNQLKTDCSQLKDRLDHQVHETSTQRVAFHARLSTSYLPTSPGDLILLPYVLYNQGQGYDPATGLFTAPYSGVYVFLLTVIPYQSHEAEVNITVDGDVVNECWTYSRGDSDACNAVLHLNAGQKVSVKSHEGGYFYARGTAFSGFLLSPDP